MNMLPNLLYLSLSFSLEITIVSFSPTWLSQFCTILISNQHTKDSFSYEDMYITIHLTFLTRLSCLTAFVFYLLLSRWFPLPSLQLSSLEVRLSCFPSSKNSKCHKKSKSYHFLYIHFFYCCISCLY